MIRGGSDASFRAVISPVRGDVHRPMWSVMIPSFNCGEYIEQALRGVLAQDPGPDQMQIEVVDDASTSGDIEAIVRRAGGERVSFFRQPRNLGHIKNFETCLNRSRGRIVHLLHGDDFVAPKFYSSLQRGFERDPEIGAAFCRHAFVNAEGRILSIPEPEQGEAGRLEGALERLSEQQRIMTPSIVVRRDVYERLGGFDSRLICSEDWEMWVRIAAHYPVWYEPQPLASYRMHSNSNSGRHARFAEELEYTRQAIDIFSGYLPSQLRKAARRARQTYAASALAGAERMLRASDQEAANAHLKTALRLSRSPRILGRTGQILLMRLFAGKGRHAS